MPDDDRLDRRRIELAVLEYRAADRRRKWPLILLVTNGVGAIAFAGMAIQLADRDHGTISLLCVLVCLLMLWAGLVAYARARSAVPTRPESLPEPTDFAGLGGGTTVAERMAHITDEPDAE